MNFNKLLFTVFLFTKITVYSFAQYCTPDDRFSSVEHFSSNEIDSLIDVTFGNAVDWQGNDEDLILDYYFPNNSIDTMTSRPFILLIHGGGFVGGDKSSWRDECRAFAKRGYVAATINYRLGYDQSSDSEAAKAVYRAQQDANTALRYFVENANTIRIDTSWIFIGGGSAGAITSLFTSYADQEEWDILFPGIESILGPLNTSGNDLLHPFTLKGIFNNWGASPSYITTPDELLPMISFHGELDNTVPIDTGANGLIGSQVLHDMLNTEGVCNDFTLDPTGGHVIYNNVAGTLFRIERASCFFKSIFCVDCNSFYSTEAIPADCSDLATDISALNDETKIKVYPNPFLEQLQFTGLKGNEQFYLFDSFGRIIFEGNNIENQNFGSLPAGLFFLTIKRGNWQQRFKLMKH